MVEMLPAASVTASAASGAASAAATGLQAGAGIAGLLYQIYKDQHLTGAQREANAFTEQMARESMNFEAGQAQQQMDFQERMANTQWQRAVSDMQAAGLNPALAYTQGANAAPSGAMASGSAGSSVDPGRGLSMSDLLSAISFQKDLALKDAQIENLEQEVEGRRIDNQIKANDLEYRDEFNSLTIQHLFESISNLVEQGNLTRFQYQVLLPAQKALAEAQKKAAESQSKEIDAKLVYTLWRNEFYEKNHFWPGESAGVMFWQIVAGAINGSSADDYLPFQGPVNMPRETGRPTLLDNYANRPKHPGFHYP